MRFDVTKTDTHAHKASKHKQMNARTTTINKNNTTSFYPTCAHYLMCLINYYARVRRTNFTFAVVI